MENLKNDLLAYREAVQEIKNAILQSRYRAAANANTEMLNLYYGVGSYISANTRSGKWGTGAIESISSQLQGEIPSLHGFSPSNMKNMRIFFEQWSPEFEQNRQLLTADLKRENEFALIRQLPTTEFDEVKEAAFYRVGFTHHREILRKCKTSDERWYYILRCADEFWSVENLKIRLRANDYIAYGSMPNNFALTIPNGQTLSKAVRSFKDEYLLDFVDIKKCLVAFELKKDKFRPSDLGQLSFYLSALDKYVKKPNENKTIGILLCQEMNQTVVELAVQDYNKPMGVATYRLGTGIPEPYTTLVPLIDGVQQILSETENKD